MEPSFLLTVSKRRAHRSPDCCQVGPDGEETEALLMECAGAHCPRLRAPKVLDTLSDTRITYIFMSLVEGETLEAVRTRLSPRQKGHLRDQRDVMLTDLHQQGPPEGALLGTLASSLLQICSPVDSQSGEHREGSELHFNRF